MQWPALAAGILALGVAIRLAGVSAPEPAQIDGLALSRTQAHEDVVLEVKVIDRRAARDGRPLLTVETRDGVQSMLYVSDDAMAVPADIGDRLRLRATVIGAGGKFLTAVKPGALTPLRSEAAGDPVLAEVRNGVAYIDGYTTAVAAPDVADGRYQGVVHTYGNNVRFVP